MYSIHTYVYYLLVYKDVFTHCSIHTNIYHLQCLHTENLASVLVFIVYHSYHSFLVLSLHFQPYAERLQDVSFLYAVIHYCDWGICQIQIGHHDTKNANFPDDTTIFLKDITCFTRMQVVLNLCIDGSSSKINLSKCQVLWTGQMKWSQFSLKYFNLTLVTLFTITSNGTK